MMPGLYFSVLSIALGGFATDRGPHWLFQRQTPTTVQLNRRWLLIRPEFSAWVIGQLLASYGY